MYILIPKHYLPHIVQNLNGSHLFLCDCFCTAFISVPQCLKINHGFLCQSKKNLQTISLFLFCKWPPKLKSKLLDLGAQAEAFCRVFLAHCPNPVCFHIIWDLSINFLPLFGYFGMPNPWQGMSHFWMCSFVTLLHSRKTLVRSSLQDSLTPSLRGASWSDEILQGTNLPFPPTDINNTVNPLLLDNSKGGKKP